MPDPLVLRRLITDAVFARLNTLSDVAVYRGEIEGHPPALVGDPEGRVGPYVVLYPFAGTPSSEEDLGNAGVDLVYTCQITCAAGYSTDCEFLVDRVHPLMFRWIPTVADLVCGSFKPPTGFDPGPVRPDAGGGSAAASGSVLPPRFSVPLQYRNTVTAN